MELCWNTKKKIVLLSSFKIHKYYFHYYFIIFLKRPISDPKFALMRCFHAHYNFACHVETLVELFIKNAMPLKLLGLVALWGVCYCNFSFITRHQKTYNENMRSLSVRRFRLSLTTFSSMILTESSKKIQGFTKHCLTLLNLGDLGYLRALNPFMHSKAMLQFHGNLTRHTIFFTFWGLTFPFNECFV